MIPPARRKVNPAATRRGWGEDEMGTRELALGRLLGTVGLLLLTACSASAPAAAPAPAAQASGGGAPSVPSAPGAAATAAPAMVRARLAFTTISAVQAPFWIAYDEGYFREQGLEVPDMNRIEPGATLLAALLNGEVEYVAAGGPSLVLGTLQGMDTMIFGSTMTGWKERSPRGRRSARGARALRGQTIAVSRLKAITDVAARLAVERLGSIPDTDVYARGTGGNTESLAALEGGTVAAASLNVPALFEANKRGYPDLIEITGMRIPFGNGTLGARGRRRWRPADRDRRARAAGHRAGDQPLQDRSRLRRGDVIKYSGIDDPEALRGTVEVYTRLFTVDPSRDPAAMQAVLDAEENPAAHTTARSK